MGEHAAAATRVSFVRRAKGTHADDQQQEPHDTPQRHPVAAIGSRQPRHAVTLRQKASGGSGERHGRHRRRRPSSVNAHAPVWPQAAHGVANTLKPTRDSAERTSRWPRGRLPIPVAGIDEPLLARDRDRTGEFASLRVADATRRDGGADGCATCDAAGGGAATCALASTGGASGATVTGGWGSGGSGFGGVTVTGGWGSGGSGFGGVTVTGGWGSAGSGLGGLTLTGVAESEGAGFGGLTLTGVAESEGAGFGGLTLTGVAESEGAGFGGLTLTASSAPGRRA